MNEPIQIDDTIFPFRLNKPLVCFDLETTSADANTAKIVQIGAIVIHRNGETWEWEQLFDPIVPIEPGATEVHGITNAAVEDSPTFEDVGEWVWDKIFQNGNCHLLGYNLKRFDIPILRRQFEDMNLEWDFHDIYIGDAYPIFQIDNPRTLTAAVKFYTGEVMLDAHEALPDVRGTLDIIKAQILVHGLTNMKELCELGGGMPDPYDGFLVDKEGVLVLGRGKHDTKTLDSLVLIDPEYLKWILKADFNNAVKSAVQDTFLNYTNV